ncbi:hypothetical protein TA3x_003913 [Tundrisphaera sp. TA3]|uniref:hypothetical protein n=1 Tax=Tundrisphaera sp. TA3 TaxID=3435775 RepID=UPI003EBF1263
MPCSPARLAANVRNASRSTGPRSPAGKAASSRNSLKHGMTGAGVVLPPGEAEEVDALSAEFEAELKPSGAMGRMLLRRVAVLSRRLERCERHDEAATARRVRDAGKARDDARRAEVDAIAATLDADPTRAIPRLLELPEGVDWVISAWLRIRGDLSLPRRVRWTEAHVDRVEHLLGRFVGMHPPTPFGPLARAAGGDFSGLTDDQGAGLDRKDRKAWARAELALLIDAEVQALGELRAIVDDENEANDRAEASERALFDASKEGQLARRYEAAAERGLFRALREFHEVEKQAAADGAPAPAPTREPRPRAASPSPTLLREEPVSKPKPSAPRPFETNPTTGAPMPAVAAPGMAMAWGGARGPA